MFYQKKKKRGRVVLAICVLLLLAGFTYGYMSNKQPQEKPHNIAELQGSENLVANNPKPFYLNIQALKDSQSISKNMDEKAEYVTSKILYQNANNRLTEENEK